MPTTSGRTEVALRRRVNSILASVVTEREWEQCRKEGWVGDAEDEPDQLDDTADQLAQRIRDWRAVYSEAGPQRDVVAPEVIDRRWELLADLDRVFQEEVPASWPSEWEPLEVVLKSARYMESPARLGQVVIAFDHRVSQRQLFALLRQIWPELGRRRYIRRTRPLGARLDALVRLVCIAPSLDSTWEERLREWNRRYPQWRYEDRLKLISSFRRAERSLTGMPHGLEWYYNPVTRLSNDELHTSCEEGDRAAVQYRQRRRDQLDEAERFGLPDDNDVFDLRRRAGIDHSGGHLPKGAET